MSELEDAVDGGLTSEDGSYSWVQTAKDITINVPLRVNTKASDVKFEVKPRSMSLFIFGDSVFSPNTSVFPSKYEVTTPDCVWSLSSSDAGSGESSLLIHLPKAKESQGFWAKLFENDTRKINVAKLGLAPGQNPKDKAPVKIEDPKMLEKIAKEHPELNLKVPNSAGAGGAKLGTQSETSASFKGKSSFSW